MKSKRPYKLPDDLLCDTDKPITMELVEEYIRLHEERIPRYNYLENLYKGFHDIFKIPEKEDWKPDNRLAVNFPKYVTDVFLGFAYGIPIKRKHPDKASNEAFIKFDKLNRITEHDYEMAKKVCKYGHAFEYFYQDEEARTRVVDLTPKECFYVKENNLRKRAYFAVRYGYTDNGATKYGEIITKEEIKEFKGSDIIDTHPNPYGKINIVEWVLNEERMGLYEEITGMTETFNKGIGEKANDVDAFAEAYLAVMGAELDEEGVMRIRDSRIINLYGTDNAKDVLVQFLTKPTADGTQENLLDRLERLMHKISMIPDINSESFGSASGIALEYRLHSMSDLARVFDEKIKKSMSKRYKLFCTLSTNIADKEAWQDIEYTTTRNTPKNKLEEAQTAAALEGMVSQETQLKVLSIIDDVTSEIKKIEKEKKKNEQSILEQAMFGVANKEDINNDGTTKETDRTE